MFNSINVKFIKIQVIYNCRKCITGGAARVQLQRDTKIFLWWKYAHYFDYDFGIATAHITHLNMYH